MHAHALLLSFLLLACFYTSAACCLTPGLLHSVEYVSVGIESVTVNYYSTNDQKGELMTIIIIAIMIVINKLYLIIAACNLYI